MEYVLIRSLRQFSLIDYICFVAWQIVTAVINPIDKQIIIFLAN